MSNYDVARHLEEDPVPSSVIETVISHLNDEPIPEDKSILQQLKDNADLSITGAKLNPDGSVKLPTGITFKDSFKF